MQSALFCDISPNPINGEIGAGRAAFLAGSHDAIIAIGGGSATDGGKANAETDRRAKPEQTGRKAAFGHENRCPDSAHNACR